MQKVERPTEKKPTHRACFYSDGQKFIMAYGVENKKTGKIDFDMRASPLNGLEYRENFEFFIESIKKKRT